jgi:hypothetical protein
MCGGGGGSVQPVQSSAAASAAASANSCGSNNGSSWALAIAGPNGQDTSIADSNGNLSIDGQPVNGQNGCNGQNGWNGQNGLHHHHHHFGGMNGMSSPIQQLLGELGGGQFGGGSPFGGGFGGGSNQLASLLSGLGGNGVLNGLGSTSAAAVAYA